MAGIVTTPGMPVEIGLKLREFLAAGKTGNVVLDIKEGRILSWKVTEYGRLVANPDTPIDKITNFPIR